MSQFDGITLFPEGRARTHVGGVSARVAQQAAIDGRGEVLTHQGVSARAIEQTGTLLADGPAELAAQAAAIEALLDGRAGVLVDEHGGAWPGVVMTGVECRAAVRVGPRWSMRLRITYAQAVPAAPASGG